MPIAPMNESDSDETIFAAALQWNTPALRSAYLDEACGIRPTGVVYNAARHLVAWNEGTNSTSVYLANIDAPNRRIELKSDTTGLVPAGFDDDGAYLAAKTITATEGLDVIRVWKIETGQVVASFRAPDGGVIVDYSFADRGRVLALAFNIYSRHEVIV